MATNISLGWDPSPDATVAGYILHYGLSGGTKQKVDVAAMTAASVSDLSEGQTYEFFVTAYDGNGIESEPSNQIVYTVPLENPVTLAVSGFKNGYVQVSPRGSGPAGNLYPQRSQVTFTATPKPGATFANWTVNGQQYLSNPLALTLVGNTTITPSFKVSPGSVVADPVTAGLSMSLQIVNGQGLLNIGGEVGAWTLETSKNMRDWQEVASGLTSDRLPLSIVSGNQFFRARSSDVGSFDQAKAYFDR